MPQAPITQKFTFSKPEKLCSQKIITALFEGGFSVASYPLRFNVLVTKLPADNVTAQVVFIVGKRRFKKATDRNRIRRQLREIYRLNKEPLLEILRARNVTAALGLIYTAAEPLSYKQIEQAYVKLINKLKHEMAV